METLIDNAIKVLTAEIKKDMSMDAALKFTQAILNLAHTKATFGMTKKD